MIKVLIVDDSIMVRELLTEIINRADDLKVVGSSEDHVDARKKIKQLRPDVLTLDIEMPKMDGISFLKSMMRLHPMPVVMISALTEKGAPATLDALAFGAIDYLQKPKADIGNGLLDYTSVIHEKIRNAASANIASFERNQQKSNKSIHSKRLGFSAKTIIALGASTGGTEAIKDILLGMPINCPPIVIAQHIPPVFSASFAARMNNSCDISVCESQGGEVLLPGHAYLAPGDAHLGLIKSEDDYVTRLSKAERVNRHRPSVEVLFDEVQKVAGDKGIAVLLTGMGNDGAQALLRLRQTGSFTLAQDEASSVVWGMPGAAVKLNAAVEVLPLERICNRLIDQASFR